MGNQHILQEPPGCINLSLAVHGLWAVWWPGADGAQKSVTFSSSSFHKELDKNCQKSIQNLHTTQATGFLPVVQSNWSGAWNFGF